MFLAYKESTVIQSVVSVVWSFRIVHKKSDFKLNFPISNFYFVYATLCFYVYFYRVRNREEVEFTKNGKKIAMVK